MSTAPDDEGSDQPGRMSGKRARLIIVLGIVLIAVVVFGYLLLVGGTVGQD